MNNTFECAACGKTYEKAWTDEEAKKESLELFGEISEEDMVIICENCFQKGKDSE